MVIRGGQMKLDTLVQAADTCFADAGVRHLVVVLAGTHGGRDRGAGSAAPPHDAAEPHCKLTALGWDLQRTRREGHVTMSRLTRPTDAEWEEAVRAFDKPQPNPGGLRRGGN